MNLPNDELDADRRAVPDDDVAHPFANPSADEPAPGRVLAVLVCHNGEQFVPRALRALAALDTKPDWLVAVDVGSEDDTLALLQVAGSPVNEILRVPEGTGFSLAVHAGIDASGASDWVWVLHDDSAPEPRALGELLSAADGQASVGVVGPKVLGWDEPRRLLEVGISISRSGRRHTGLEDGEQDQGQHDGQRDVLAVGSAGALIRREVWDRLGGFDKSIRLFRDDVDFGWRANLAGYRVVVATDAVIHHAEAAAHGRRRGLRRIHRDDRTSALYVLLVNSTVWTLWMRWLWLVFVSLVRALGFLVGKSPQEAAGEMSAIGQALFRPRPIRRGRRSRRRRREVPQRSLRRLFPPPGQQLRQTAETFASSLTVTEEVEPSSALESGSTDEDLDVFATTGSGRIRRLVRRPGSLLFITLVTLGLVAWRGLYRGGVLHGGALLPVPNGASDLWSTYLASWHPISAGSPVVAPPSLAVFGGFATLVFGKATWVVPIIMVVGPALAGLVAYWLLTTLAVSTRLRLWAAVAYALNPALLAAIMQGRWSTVVVAVVLPLLAFATVRACGVHGREPSGRAAAASALLLSIAVAVAPVMLLPLELIGVIAVLRLASAHRARLRLTAALLAPVVLLLPWVPQVLSDPALLLLEPGVPLSDNPAPPWHVLLLNPGGLAALPLVLGVGIVVAGVAATVRASDVRAIRYSIGFAMVGLAWALVITSISITPGFSAVPVAPWAGPPLVLAAAGLIAAAAIAARSSRRRLESRALSWRQPALALVTGVAVILPIFTAVWWIESGSSGVLYRGVANPMPAFVRAQSELPTQIRTLVLEPSSGRLTYTLLRRQDSQFGDVEISPPAAKLSDLDAVVADLASGRGSAPVDQLAQYAVQYILAVPPVDPALEVALDSAPGLLRVANPGESSLWRLQRPTGRLRVRDSDRTSAVLPSGTVDAQVPLPAGTSDRLLELAELADSGWTASANGEELGKQSVAGWSQGFVATAAPDTVVIEHSNRGRSVMFLVQLLAFVVAVVMALPSRRRKQEVVV
ncbi:MAG TPA: glycosyltransferase family 2 protein [Actinomycetes bacterium]|nr:glycosyltransferase family 2 protein [Actinomycetes bacterium]